MKKWIQRQAIINPKKKDNIFDQLCAIRGIINKDEFFNPDEKHLHDPKLINNLEEIVFIIYNYLMMDKGSIAISVDPDVDGVITAITLYRYFLDCGFTHMYLMYHQRSKGHGVEHQADQVQEGTGLIIVLDSSTGEDSAEACKTFKEQGIEVVILDHHPEEPHKHALIANPQLDDYPNKHLSGAGVLYKALTLLDEHTGGCADDYLDLIACGMYADVMSVEPLENRYIMLTGIDMIRDMSFSVNRGLAALLEVNKINNERFDSQTIGYTIAPTINGVARMEKIEVIISLLLEDDYGTCIELATEAKELNEQRKVIQKDLFNKYSEQLDHEQSILVAIDENASKGFNGLVANMIAEKYQKPAMVLRKSFSSLNGSYRTYGDFDLKEFLNKQKFVSYAKGHPQAGGIGIKEYHIKRLYSAIEKEFDGITYEPKIMYDLVIDANEISELLVEQLEVFDKLTGKDFPASKILVTNVFVEQDNKKRSVIIMGANNDTVKIICDGFNVIKFRTEQTWASDVSYMNTIDVIGQLKLNVWEKWDKKKVVSVQIMADDYSKKIEI